MGHYQLKQLPAETIEAVGVRHKTGRRAGEVSLAVPTLAVIASLEDRPIEFRDGVTVDLPPGERWISIEPISKILYRQLYREEPPVGDFGRTSFYQQVYQAVQTLERRGLLEKTGPVRPDLTGQRQRRTGNLYKVNLPEGRTDWPVSPLAYYTSREPGDVLSEIAAAYSEPHTEHVKRFRFTKAGKLEWYRGLHNFYGWSQKANRGEFDSAHHLTGCWQENDVANKERPVTVPWIVLDLDDVTFTSRRMWGFLNYIRMRRILGTLRNYGVDLDRVLVSYTGGKGFHIRIPHALVGCPVYANSLFASMILKNFVRGLFPDADVFGHWSVDTNPLNPTGLIRAIGCKRENGGGRCAGFRGSEILKILPRETAAKSENYRPMDRFPVPESGGINPELLEIFRRSIPDRSRLPHYDPEEDVHAMLGGVNQGNRNQAAVKVCHHVLRSGGGFDEVLSWNNLNSPPLGMSEIETVWRRAAEFRKSKGLKMREPAGFK